MERVFSLQHPLVRCHLTTVRDKRTEAASFRQAVSQLTSLLAVEATATLPTCEIPTETPLEACIGHRLGVTVGLHPVLRAGDAMVEPMLSLLPDAEVWHLGMYRDEATSKPVHYYNKLPSGKPVDVAFILDPMLATGGSLIMACDMLKDWGAKTIRMLSIIAAPEGIRRVVEAVPDIEIFTCAIDDRLNEANFIVPGLGDAGDRVFNTSRSD